MTKKRGDQRPQKSWRSLTLTLNSSVESQEPIFNSAVSAGAAAEPNSRAEANKGSNCKPEDKIMTSMEKNLLKMKKQTTLEF